MNERRKPGRPREFDRTQAVRAAADLFWERGFRDATALELARTMGISRSSFYNEFGDRDAVFTEAIETYLAGAPDAALAALAPDAAIMPALWSVFRELCRVRAADDDARGCLMVNSIAELAGSDTEAGDVVRDIALRRVEQLDALLEAAEQRAEVPKFKHRRRTANAVMTFLCGINVMSKLVRSERVLWGICQETLVGLGLPPPPRG